MKKKIVAIQRKLVSVSPLTMVFNVMEWQYSAAHALEQFLFKCRK